MPRGVQDVTGIDKAGIERLLLLADFSMTLNGVFNSTATTSEHAVFKTIPSTGVLRTVNLTATGSVAPNLNQAAPMLFTDSQLPRPHTRVLTWSVPPCLASGPVP